MNPKNCKQVKESMKESADKKINSIIKDYKEFIHDMKKLYQTNFAELPNDSKYYQDWMEHIYDNSIKDTKTEAKKYVENIKESLTEACKNIDSINKFLPNTKQKALKIQENFEFTNSFKFFKNSVFLKKLKFDGCCKEFIIPDAIENAKNKKQSISMKNNYKHLSSKNKHLASKNKPFDASKFKNTKGKNLNSLQMNI